MVAGVLTTKDSWSGFVVIKYGNYRRGKDSQKGGSGDQGVRGVAK